MNPDQSHNLDQSTTQTREGYFISQEKVSYIEGLLTLIEEVNPEVLYMIFPMGKFITDAVAVSVEELTMAGFSYELATRLSIAVQYPNLIPSQLRPDTYDIWTSRDFIGAHTGEVQQFWGINPWYENQVVQDFVAGKINEPSFRSAFNRIPGLNSPDIAGTASVTEVIESSIRELGWQGKLVYILIPMSLPSMTHKEVYRTANHKLTDRLGTKGQFNSALNIMRHELTELANHIRSVKYNTDLYLSQRPESLNHPGAASVLNYGTIVEELWTTIGTGELVAPKIDDAPLFTLLGQLTSLSFENYGASLPENVFDLGSWQEAIIKQFIHAVIYTKISKKADKDDEAVIAELLERSGQETEKIFAKIKQHLPQIIQLAQKSPLHFAIEDVTGIDVSKGLFTEA